MPGGWISDSQAASQVIAMGSAIVNGGSTITKLPKPEVQRSSNKGQFLGAYAYKVTGEKEENFKGKTKNSKPFIYLLFC